MGTEKALRIAMELGKPYVGPTKGRRRTFWEKLYGDNLVPGSNPTKKTRENRELADKKVVR